MAEQQRHSKVISEPDENRGMSNFAALTRSAEKQPTLFALSKMNTNQVNSTMSFYSGEHHYYPEKSKILTSERFMFSLLVTCYNLTHSKQ
jgi:hypothetical protein